MYRLADNTGPIQHNSITALTNQLEKLQPSIAWDMHILSFNFCAFKAWGSWFLIRFLQHIFSEKLFGTSHQSLIDHRNRRQLLSDTSNETGDLVKGT